MFLSECRDGSPSENEYGEMQPTALAILAAESDPGHAGRLFRSLALLGYRAELASSGRDAMDLIRRNLFCGAVVAAELTYENEPVISRLAKLPSVKCLIAIGTSNDPEMERHARQLGADVYLTRPVTIEALAKALRPELMRTVDAAIRPAALSVPVKEQPMG